LPFFLSALGFFIDDVFSPSQKIHDFFFVIFWNDHSVIQTKNNKKKSDELVPGNLIEHWYRFDNTKM